MTLRITPAELVERAAKSGRPGLLALAPHWSRIRLGDIARVVNGAAFPSIHFNVDGVGMPLIRIRDIGASEPSTWYSGHWEDEHLVRRGDILVGMDGDFRVARWVSHDALLNQRVCRIDVDGSRYDERFLHLVLPGYVDAIWAATSSTTVKHLSSRSIADIPLPMPGLDEQRQIVGTIEDHFSRLTAAESLLSSAAGRARALRSLWHATLADASVPRRTLGDLSVSAGYGTSTKCVVNGAGAPVVRIPNLQLGRIDLKSEKRAADPSVDLTPLMLAQDDLLIVRTNGSRDLIGRAAVVQSGVKASFASYLIRFKLDSSIIRPHWARVMMGTPQTRRMLEGMAASSAGQYNLGLKKLEALPIPCPPLEQQDQLLSDHGEREWQIETLAAEIKTASDRASGLRRAVLTAAVAGQLPNLSGSENYTEEMASV